MQGITKGQMPHGKEILRVAGGRELPPNSLLPGDLIFKYYGD